MINNADLFSQPPLHIFTKGAKISEQHCTSCTVENQVEITVFLNTERTFIFKVKCFFKRG